MNDMLREEILEDLGLSWCSVTNSYVSNDCFDYCESCDEYISMMNYYFSDNDSENVK